MTHLKKHLALIFILALPSFLGAQMPTIVGNWWDITGVPDLPPQWNNPDREPVDFAIWQAEDGTWQAVSCIRKTGPQADTRLFFRWEGESLFDTNWEQKGIFMMSEARYGEDPQWIQAPYVHYENEIYYFFYGGGDQINLATGTDGKEFERVLNEDGQSRIFIAEDYGNARDIMVMKSGGTYYGYYTGSHAVRWPDQTYGAIFCRTSTDLETWSEEIKVSEGGIAGGGYTDAECPFVVERPDGYYLFKTQDYTNPSTTVYRSTNPLDFGIDNDEYRLGTIPVAAPEIFQHEGEWYMAALKADLNGLRIAKLEWPDPADNLGSWADYPLMNFQGDVNTQDLLGYIRVYQNTDYIWSYSLESWLYLPENYVYESGAWIYAMK